MDNKLSVAMKEKNESSSCMIFVVSVMLLSLLLFAALPPVLNRHAFDVNNLTEDSAHITRNGGNKGEISGEAVGGYTIDGKGGNVIQIVTTATLAPTTTTTTTTTTTSTTTTTPPVKEKYTTTVVHTKLGSIRGIMRDGVRIFHGIPYAQPPIGDLRWRPPVEPKPWGPTEFDATWHRPGCPQICAEALLCPHNTSEDCLFMEIYTPQNVSPKTSLLPVLVYIHGGSFKDMSCTSPIFDATKFVQKAGVITVFVEYRLGALGFLVSGEGKGQAHGNYGILDQEAALKWVKNNIEDFGGDSSKITLVGQSAGAQSVLIHLMSDDTSQLFQNVIVESPPLTLPFKTAVEAGLQGFKLADKVNCVDDEDIIDMNCLRQKDANDIVKVQHSLSLAVKNNLGKVETWGPVVDNDILKAQMVEGLKQYSQTRGKAKPIIWGLTSEEAALYVFRWFKNPTSEFMYSIGTSMLLSKKPDRFYDLYAATHSDTREDMSVLGTDLLFRCPIRKSVREMAVAGDENVWAYTWAHALDGPLPADYALCTGRVCHGMEIPFVFRSFSSVNFTASDTDLSLSDKIIKFYSNFIKYSNPNGHSRKKSYRGEHDDNGQIQIPHWSAVRNNLGGKSYSQLMFKNDGLVEMVRRNEDERCDMWDERGYFLR